MIHFANAKINLGLRIIRRRPDGYHDLETVFYPIPLYDVVEIVDAPVLSFHLSGAHIPSPVTLAGTDQEDNLCLRAHRLLQVDFDLPPVAIYLHKVIPVGAGLGGGSSDAAYTLRLLNEKYGLGLEIAALERYASQLGADCSFFIRNTPVFATGIGNVFDDIHPDFHGFEILLVHPDIHISTAEAYRGITSDERTAGQLRQTIMQPVSEWREGVVNDFEQGLFIKYPVLSEIKDKLYDIGSIYASMSGSGSCMYGIFRKGSIPSDAQESLRKIGGNIRIFALCIN